MKNKIVVSISIVLLVIITAVFAVINLISKKNKVDNNQYIENTLNNATKIDNINENKESEKIMNTIIKISINNKIYNAILEQNETAKQFESMLPQEFNMSELNGNEKYIYLDKNLPTNSYKPNKIEAGDIMLYGNNCLVVFYKSFNSSYSYTKIGHIEDLEDLGNKDIIIKFEK